MEEQILVEEQSQEENKRKRVHIALVGGQPVPVYVGILYTQPDEIILIHSVESKKEAERIASLVSDIPIAYKEFTPVNMRRIIDDVNVLANELNNDNECYIDITSGTKPWSIAFFQAFSNKPSTTIIYIGQNNGIYDMSSGMRTQFDGHINMDDIFALYNTKAENYIRFSDVTEDDLRAVDELMKMRRCNFKAFYFLTQRDGSMKRIGDDHFDDGSTIEWNKEEGWIQLYLARKKKSPYYRKFSSPHIFRILFNAGWFEFDVARRLSKWKIASDIRIGVKFPYREGLPKNEIDIILNLGSRLLFVECKTQIQDITALDKFSKAVRNFGGLSSKSLFVTLAQMKELTKQKCNDNDILAFSYADVEYNMSEVEMGLKDLLSSNIYQINRR